MKKILQRLSNNYVLFLIVNTAFWLGLGYFLLSSPVRTAVGAGVLATFGGGYLLYSGLVPGAMEGPQNGAGPRWLVGIFGILTLAFGVASLVWVASGGVPTERQRLKAKLGEAARGSTYLDLSEFGLREVPPEVWEFTHLKILYLSDNRLQTLPPEIGNLVYLETLDLDNNKLTALPPEIGALKQLDTLYVNDNQLTELPPEIGDMEKLYWLELDDNRLTAFPPELARLENLQYLKFQFNRFEVFPDVVLELPALELLWLSGNQVGPLPESLPRRAEEGALNLWYEPRLSRFDWASAIVIFFCLILPVLLTYWLSRRWAAQELALQQAARAEGEVFVIPPAYRGHLLWVFWEVLAISTFFFIASLGENTGVSLESGIGLAATLSPLPVFALYMLLPNTGLVLLTSDAVVLRRFKNEVVLPYADIVQIHERRLGLPLRMVIKGHDRTLRIPTSVQNFQRLYSLLLKRMPLLPPE